MFKVTICDFGKMNINMTDKIEKKESSELCISHRCIHQGLRQKVVWFLQDGDTYTRRIGGKNKQRVICSLDYIVLRRIASKRPLLFDPK